MAEVLTERSLDTGVTTVRLVGEATGAALPACRSGIAKAAAQCPVAVIVDLAELRYADASFASMVAAATFNAQELWGVPVLLCAANAEIRTRLKPFRTFIALYEQHPQASLAVRAYIPRWITKRLPPVPESAAATRSLVGEACLSWGLRHLRDPARLVASELASNAIVHATTEFDVMISYTGRYLRIGVADGSSKVPALIGGPPAGSTIMADGPGRGLRIIAKTATHCGITRTRDGKIVWVLMRTRPD